MKTYRIRMNCVSFEDIEVQASSKLEARQIAETGYRQCNQAGMEFGEFLTD